jgi:segregation and condensation protein B
MSLKAKLEAVVYAAEEPVTLAQLASIFAEEVFHGLDEAAAQDPAAEQIGLAGLSPEAEAGTGEEAAAEDAQPTEATVPLAAETAAAGAETSESEEKKLPRQRDRRVRQVLQGVLDELVADYANSERGMEIREIAGGYRMATKPEYHDAVRGFVKSLKPPMKLSLQALETLAVIAYKQPVTAPEVSEIRGVDSGGVLGGLVSRKLITTAGRKPVIGRPILYKTTKEFLLRFGLKDVNDLPSMEEFEKMAGELAESEAEGEAQDASMRSADPVLDGEGSGPVLVEAAEGEADPREADAGDAPAETGAPETGGPEAQEWTSSGITSEPDAVTKS